MTGHRGSRLRGKGLSRYRLGITQDINFEHIIQRLSNLRINPPEFISSLELSSFHFPSEIYVCEDTLYTLVDDSMSEEIKNSLDRSTDEFENKKLG